MKIACDLRSSLKFYDLPFNIINEIREDFSDVEIYMIKGNGQEPLTKDTEVYWGNRIVPNIVEDHENLKWVHFGSTGTDRLHECEKAKNLIVTNSRGLVTPEMTTSVIGFMTLCARRYDYLINSYQKFVISREDYNNVYEEVHSLEGKNCYIFGYGDMGRSIAKALNGLGMKVIGFKRSLSKAYNDSFANIEHINNLHRFIEKADYIVNCLPLNLSTKDFFNWKIFQKMHCQCFINVGRGETVNEEDLIKAIQNQNILYAYLDVVKDEPISLDNKLLNEKSIFVTPHVAAVSKAYWFRQRKLIKQNIRLFKEGLFSEMINKVDFPY